MTAIPLLLLMLVVRDIYATQSCELANSIARKAPPNFYKNRLCMQNR